MLFLFYILKLNVVISSLLLWWRWLLFFVCLSADVFFFGEITRQSLISQSGFGDLVTWPVIEKWFACWLKVWLPTCVIKQWCPEVRDQWKSHFKLLKMFYDLKIEKHVKSKYKKMLKIWFVLFLIKHKRYKKWQKCGTESVLLLVSDFWSSLYCNIICFCSWFGSVKLYFLFSQHVFSCFDSTEQVESAGREYICQT